MKNTYPPVSISGPHGGGKSTLVEKLKRHTDLFLENNFDIDFTIDFPSISALSHFERSLLRIYHRFFIAGYTKKLVKENPEKVILTNRTIYDSEAYINVYHELKWITENQFQKLNFVINNFTARPHAIILNPPLEVIRDRLGKRRGEATRTNRDKIFKNEDSDEFLDKLHHYFTRFKDGKRFVYVEDNDEVAIQKIIDWVKVIQ